MSRPPEVDELFSKSPAEEIDRKFSERDKTTKKSNFLTHSATPTPAF